MTHSSMTCHIHAHDAWHLESGSLLPALRLLELHYVIISLGLVHTKTALIDMTAPLTITSN